MGLKKETPVCTVRDFGFSEIEWQIKNYFAATCKENWVIDSPVFTVNGKECTEWRLSLKSDHMQEKSFVSMYLERLECDPSPDPVWVSWKLFYPFDTDRMAFEAEADFERKKIVGIQISDIDTLENRMRFDTNDTLVIRCLMMVYNRDSKIYERPKDPGLKSLSQDLKVLYRVSKKCDIKIHVDGLPTAAHKAVLCSRNKVLKAAIENGKSVINLPNLDLEATKNLFGYLYTGHLDYVLRKPSFSLLKCIKYLEIKELESYYKHDELILCSEFGVKDYPFNWIVSDIKSANVDCVFSPLFVERDLNISFRLHLYPKGFNKESEFMSLFFEIIEGSFPETLYLEVVIMDSNGNFQHLERKRWSFNSGEKFGFESFFSRDIFEGICLAGGKNLQILCYLRSPTASKVLTVRSKICSNIAIETEQHYELLSDQIVTLFESGKYSDFTVKCDGEYFKVHKRILCARSHVFKRLFTMAGFLGRDKSFKICNIKSNVLRVVFRYMYSGKLKKYEIDDILKIYKAAEKIYILPLKYRCSDILQSSIGVHNVSEILRLADKNKDYKLKASVLKFISSNLPEHPRGIAGIDINK